MKHDYFEDKIKEILEEGEPQAYDRRQWRQLNKRLQESKGRPQVWWIRWMPVLLLLFSLAFGWQVVQQKRLLTEVKSLQSRLAENQTIQAETGNTSKVVTTIYDTIYRSVEVVTKVPSERSVKDALTGWYPNELMNLGLFSTIEATPLEENRRLSFRDGYLNYLQSERRRPAVTTTVPSATNLAAEEIPALAIAPLITSALLFLPNQAPAYAPNEPTRASWLRRASHQLKPKAYQVEVGLGSYRQWELADEEAISAGIGLEAIMGKRFSFRLGGGYLQRFLRMQGTEAEMEDIPIIAPRNPGDQLTEVSGDLNYLQIPLGLRYYLLQRDQVSVFTEAGIGTAIGLNDAIRYQYTDVDGNQYELEDRSALPTKAAPNFYYGRLGFRYRLGAKLHFQLNALQQYGLGSFDYSYQQARLFHWRIGMDYRL